MPSGLRRLWGLIGLLVGFAVSGCGGSTTTAAPALSTALQGDVAGRFAAAVLRGDAAGARALLVHPDEAALMYLVRRAAVPWRNQHASIRLPARRAGNRWTFGYAGRRTYGNGRFETESGDLVVLVGPSATGAGVRYFVFTDVRRRYGTHHDAQLLPSNR